MAETLPNKDAAINAVEEKVQTSPAVAAVEDAKRRAAIRAVEDYFEPTMRYVGIGSGTTIQYVVEAIKERVTNDIAPILFIPTGSQSRMEIEKRGLIAVGFDSVPENVMLDVAFDGADEIDPEMNCVKGGGACLFQEKLVAMKAKRFVCVADFRKDVPRLLTEWSYIPIEVTPLAVKPVLKSLRALGSPNPELRMLEVIKAGPLKTDQDFYIIKAPFPPLLMEKDLKSVHEGEGQTKAMCKNGLEGRVWEAGKLATAIKGISGVLEVGLFVGMNGPQATKFNADDGLTDLGKIPDGAVTGSIRSKGAHATQGGQKPVAVYFGMADGSVKVKKAPEQA